jgi:adenine/guanine phosphoribosyltransferase-like PRPP-binding protein
MSASSIFFFPPGAGLRDHVHAFGLQAVPDRREVFRQFRHLELRRVVGVEPDGIAAAHRIAQVGDEGGVQEHRRVGDQRDGKHRVSER